MLKLSKYIEKTKDEAFKKCFQDLDCTIDDILYVEDELAGSLFKTKKCQLVVIKKDDIIVQIKEFFKNLQAKMNIDINIEIKNENNIFNVLIVSSNNPILIGKDGKTLNAIQSILRSFLNKQSEININVSLDIANYKRKRIRNFEYEIDLIAREVEKTGIETKLDSMNSYNRRLVHNVVNKYSSLKTESIGEEPERCVIISKK